MASSDQIAEEVRKLLAPRLDALQKKFKDIQQLNAESDSLKAENRRKDAQVEVLMSENAAMKRRLDKLEQRNCSRNVILSSIPKEKHGA